MGDQQAAIHTAPNSDHIWNKYHYSYTQAEKTGIQVPQLYYTNRMLRGHNILLQAQRAYIAFTLGSWRGFSVITSPNPHLSGWNLEYKWGGHGVHSHKKWGKSSHGFRLRLPKRVFFLSNAVFWPLILHRYRSFLKKDANRCPHVYTGQIFPKVCTGGFPGPKNTYNGYFQWGDCAWGTAQTA